MRIGTDIIEIERVYEASQRQAHFAKRILSAEEYALYDTYSPKRQQTFLAGRFSAKEAYGKALGTGVGHWLKFDQLSVMPDAKGAPQWSQGPITEGVRVSISHSRDYATATVLIELSDEEIARQLEKGR
ncbi:holo-[acyl-carrier-protein] synthase [Suicoccus acidiformans]|uniref:Holo-[acyl-carrier-protein] synthase n=1 Tax=Suicoccus acidiformans TaxID=2036206 RepID=A0A347WHU5_9LACT|nr:holo-ACP synthase [Suicoccus acidiformans]AXY24652.1 holo-[acyl-carrier-protein] synthase [Suicoccus acidiformans]